jgi:hypothetical protein
MARVGRWLKRIVIVIVLAIVVVVAYNMVHDKITGPPPQAANISDLRSLNTALHTYKSVYGHYPDSLKDLGVPAAGPSNEQGAGLIGSRLAAGKAHGYSYTYAKSAQGYSLHADPDTTETNIHLYSDENAEVRFKRKAPADRDSEILQ